MLGDSRREKERIRGGKNREERERDARVSKKGEREGEENERVWREKEEDFSPRASLHDGKISIAREREREKVRGKKIGRAGKSAEERERERL